MSTVPRFGTLALEHGLAQSQAPPQACCIRICIFNTIPRLEEHRLRSVALSLSTSECPGGLIRAQSAAPHSQSFGFSRSEGVGRHNLHF